MNTNAKRIKVITRPELRVDAAALEDESRRVIELITTWRGTVIRVDVLRADGKAPSRFRVGEDPKCDLQVPAETLGGLAELPLVAALPGGGAQLTLPPGAAGDVTSEGGRRASFAELAAAGESHPSEETPGCMRVLVPAGAIAVAELGGFGFVAKSVPAPRPLTASFKLSRDNHVFGGASLAFHFLVVAIAFFDVPDLLAMSLDLGDGMDKGVTYVPLEQQKKEAAEKEKDVGSEGKRARDEEGQMGKRDARVTHAKYAIKGLRDNPTPRLQRDMAREAGILSYLTAANAPVSPFGADSAFGQDPENALGDLMGNRFGDSFGYGGLGVHGTGRGGGGDGTETIGVGDLDTIGRDGHGPSKRYGDIGDPRDGVRKPGNPVRPINTGAVVKGSLSKETIRRVVHRHLNEVKFCYERELASRPDVTGRVSVQFVIDGMGAVQTAVAKESTLGSAALDACIALAVRRWTFPQPDGGGVVIVTYPFQLETPQD
ncbi:MAG: AgmX/PglI C-terminal domain-containing protein [Proteobacteria bacterium]|jgi:hypothetical protein|nr:AgmX/PglI C-terminal domain-containing protein [Pseudomonadota bacterium]